MEQIATSANVHVGSLRRAALARAYTHRLLSGDRVAKLDAHGGPVVNITEAEVSTFANTAPVSVLTALATAGRRYLRGWGIDEPSTWQPPLNPPEGASLPRDQPEPWAARRPARGAPDGVTAQVIRESHQRGQSIRATAAQMGLSRQSIARTLHADGFVPVRGRTRRFTVGVRVEDVLSRVRAGEGGRSCTSYLLNASESPAAPWGPCVGGFDAAGFAMGLGAAPNMPFSPRGLAPRSSVFGRSLMMRATPPPQSHPRPRRVHSWVA